MQAAPAMIIPKLVQSIACARKNGEGSTPAKTKWYVSTMAAIAVTAAVSANRIHSARRRSTATAADMNARADMEKYWPSAMRLAPGSTLMAPWTGCPSAFSALVQIGWASSPSGSTWKSTHSAGTAAANNGYERWKRETRSRQGAGSGLWSRERLQRSRRRHPAQSVRSTPK